jgi:hypothetical protein
MVQIIDDLGSVEDVVALATEESRPLLLRAYDLIVAIHPDVVIVPRLGEKSLSFGFGSKKMSEAYCYLIPFAKHVNLGFFHGATIDDQGVLEGSGKLMRHIKIRDLDQLDDPTLTALVSQAIDERRAGLLAETTG